MQPEITPEQQELIDRYHLLTGERDEQGKLISYPPSIYQAKIYEWIERGRGDEIVNAVAGSGKTTTLVNGAKLLTGQAIFIAFSKKIQETLSEKLAGTSMTAKTVHSIGYGMVANYLRSNNVRMKSPDDKKYRKLAHDWVSQNQALDGATKALLDDDIVPDWTQALLDLMHYCRVTLTDPMNGYQINPRVYQVASKYGVETYGFTDLLVPGVVQIVNEGALLARNSGDIDFTDMIYLPYFWRLPAPQYMWVFCDECQDLSACQLDLVLKCRAKGGRMLFVGDPNQAIFGFAGADADSFWTIKNTIQANGLPLSVNYRCPASHIQAVRDRGTVPHIEARPNAPKGIIRDIKDPDLIKEVREGDMIICRLTAPLISTAIELIANRIPARVFGRDIGRELGSLAEKIAKKCHDFEQFGEAISTYYAKEVKRLSKKEGNETRIQSLADKCECVRVIYESSKVDNLIDLIGEINSLFSDDRASVTLCTVHRAKGLENPRIFIISPDKLPFKYKKQQDWQWQQELNLEYVAMTRAMDEIIYVRSISNLPTGAAVQAEVTSLIDSVLNELGISTTTGPTIDLLKPGGPLDQPYNGDGLGGPLDTHSTDDEDDDDL